MMCVTPDWEARARICGIVVLENVREVRFAPISIRGTGVPCVERIGEIGIWRFALDG